MRGDELVQADNLILIGKGVPTKRWGTKDYFQASATGSVRGVIGLYQKDGTNQLLSITDQGVLTKVLYFSTPASLASPADIVTCPNPEYLVEGVIADIWEAQEDARFQAAKAQANITLSNMLEFEFTPSEAAYNRGVKTYEQRYGFKWGK